MDGLHEPVLCGGLIKWAIAEKIQTGEEGGVEDIIF